MSRQCALRVHFTNVAGTGATQLLLSLLPALEREAESRIETMYLPCRGALADYRPSSELVGIVRYDRFLPNSVSRFLECTVFAGAYSGQSALLVLGDLPLRCTAPQVLLVHNPHLCGSGLTSPWSHRLRFIFMRAIFSLNASRVLAFMVQTTEMARLLVARYPETAGRVRVVQMPVPEWLLQSGLVRRNRRPGAGELLSLIYPAAEYPHKNHKLLRNVHGDGSEWPVERLILTVPTQKSPAPSVPWIRCVGLVSQREIVAEYEKVDALLFMSTDETYGFPLLEAMYVGLPIVCPDLPYARALCGDGAIYFNPLSAESLREALELLRERLLSGWWPEWSSALRNVPKSWDEVARTVLRIVEEGQCAERQAVS